MGDSKRWTVTYTKHIKQKRKVYQDGFLQFHISTGKERTRKSILKGIANSLAVQVKLYDECEKLLECRLLKNDETVTSGETLIFKGYLVDVGDPEGGIKPESDLNVDRKLRNHSRFRTPSEFKKRELLKYGSPKISQETPKPSTEEWLVLYTTQVTQKAKKYHDGFLRLVLHGSSGAQVMLFDTSRKLLDSRFLKKDDVIKSGESIAFDSYLIDIGKQQGSCTPDSNVLADKCTDVKAMKMDRQKTSLKTDTHVNVGKSEWQVLYTTQLTKKAKKYHDGFLHIELCGSFGKQVVLYDLSKRPIERRFVRKDEVIREGESVYFDGHLVEVGQPEGSHHSPAKLNERGTGNNVERRQLGHGQNGFHKVNPSFAKGKPPNELCLGKDSGLNSLITELEEIKSNRITPPIKPLRDGGRSSNGSRQNIGDRESAATSKCLDITSSEAAYSGGSFQFTENVNMSHQSDSQKDAQTNMSSEADFGCQPCLITNGGKSGEEFSCESETFPSFDLGF
ncbi:hypothetical protein JHK87_013576 [Glycine soja]|nr:hypothetical protein JHK87_013576 [Glycine soja]